MSEWAFLFPGQGSQFLRMGEDLWRRFPEFKGDMEQIDALVRDRRGYGFLDMLYGDDDDGLLALTDLRVSHPAIFSVQYAASRLLIRRGVRPSCVAGASLGEVTAVTLAGGCGAEAAVDMICEHSDRIVEECEPGGMTAVFVSPRLWSDDVIDHHECDLVSINGPEHFVIAGARDGLRALVSDLDARGINYLSLPVNYPFHSTRLDSLKNHILSGEEAGVGASMRVPFYSSATGGRVDAIETGHWWKVSREPIRAGPALKGMAEDGLYRCIEIGPGTSMSAILRQQRIRSISNHVVMTPFLNSIQLVEAITELGDDGASPQQARTADQLEPPRTTPRESLPVSHTESEQGKDSRMRAYVFPGQGSQFIGMGKDLFDAHERELADADRILGWSVKNLCSTGPKERLDSTEFTQPALYVVNALTYLTRMARGEPRPDFVAGHSLGEYNALHAAGVFDFATGLGLVKQRGRLMAQARGGGMAVILGLKPERVTSVLADARKDAVDVANLNSPDQVVISGLRDDVLACEEIFISAGARFMPLNVSGAFHSRYMRQAREQFEGYLRDILFKEPCCPVVSNVTARPYGTDVPGLLGQQITSPVNWVDTVRYLLRRGATIEQVGPGRVLTGLTRATLRSERDEPLTKGARTVRPARAEKVSEKESRTVSVASSYAPESGSFCSTYGLRLPYVSGSMYRGIASKELVERMARAGMLSFVGTGGMPLEEITASIEYLQRRAPSGASYGFNLLHSHDDPRREDGLVSLFLARDVNLVEASAFVDVTPALVRYRLKGVRRGDDGSVVVQHRIMAKLSRPEVAEIFLSPPPEKLVKQLLDARQITSEEAELAPRIRMADDITAEADSGGHTDAAVSLALIPTIARLRDSFHKKDPHLPRARVGAAGGIGTPESAAAAFVLGAEYVVTGSINQCTVESGASETVKNLLQDINVQDTDYAPAGDMFELGSRVQVLRRGVFFPARANKLYSLYRQYDSLDAIDPETRRQLEGRYFHRTFESIWEEVRDDTRVSRGQMPNDRQRMLAVFKWYFAHSTQLALSGDKDQVVDFQVHCGPALGAFNQWVKGTGMEDWHNRHVDDIAIKLMDEVTQVLDKRTRRSAANAN